MIRIEEGSISRQQNRARVCLSAAVSLGSSIVGSSEGRNSGEASREEVVGAVGLEPQDRSCSRRVRSAESGFEGKSLCERLFWVWRYCTVQRGIAKGKRSEIRKLFCPSIQEFGKANILRQAPKREPAELYCETAWIAFFWPSVPS